MVIWGAGSSDPPQQLSRQQQLHSCMQKRHVGVFSDHILAFVEQDNAGKEGASSSCPCIHSAIGSAVNRGIGACVSMCPWIPAACGNT